MTLNRILLLIVALFFIEIWTSQYIVVKWEDQPDNATGVWCVLEDEDGISHALKLTQFVWTSTYGEWYVYYSFAGHLWFANCTGYVGNQAAIHASGLEDFQFHYKLFTPFIHKLSYRQ